MNNGLKSILVLMILCMTNSLFAQIAPNKYWVSLSDKNNNDFSLSNPEEFLTQRSLDRRTVQDIALDIKDIPVTQDYINQIDAVADVDILYASKWFNAVAIYSENPDVMTDLLALPFVSMVKSVKGHKGKDFVLDDREIVQPILTSRLPDIDYGLSFNQVDMLNGIPLHEAGFEGQGMLIAVIDAGFRFVDELLAFEALFDENRILATKDFVQGDNGVYEDWVSSHGMFVLSTIAGILPDSAYGTATQAEFLLLRSEDTDSELRIEEHNWIAAAEYADSLGSDVLTTSLGYTTFDEESMDYTYEDLDGDTGVLTIASDIAASRGMLVVNSAGNSGSNDWHYIGIAADGDSVLAIGAVNSVGIHTSFSSFGPSADGRVKPNVMAQGRDAVVCDFDNTPRTSNGTSFSGPILAGMAACLWQMHPEAGNMEVFHAIEESASLYTTPNDSMGYGIPDFWAAHLILENATGIEESIIDHSFRIYPNPATNSIYINLELKEPESIYSEIFDSKGALVTTKESILDLGHQFIVFDVTELATGNYVIRLSGGHFYKEGQFVISRP